MATKEAQNERKMRIAQEERKEAENKANALKMKGELTGKVITVKVKCNEDKMYGSVTTQDVAKALLDAGYTVDKKKITLPSTIKTLGKYEIEVWLYKETTVKLTIDVVAQ